MIILEKFITGFLRGLVLGFLIVYVSKSCARATEPVRIAVVDTGYDQKSTWPSNASYVPKKICGTYDTITWGSAKDNHGHGTSMVGIIAHELNASRVNYCVYIVKALMGSSEDYVKALEYISKLDVDVVNISAAGQTLIPGECSLIKNILDKGAFVVAAAGNDGVNTDYMRVYPAFCDYRVYKLYNVDKTGKFAPTSNTYGRQPYRAVTEVGVDVVTTGLNNRMIKISGTSPAAAKFSAKIAKEIFRKERCVQRKNSAYSCK